jgi:hypothetical protein
MTDQQAVAPQPHVAYHMGLRYSELSAILQRIGRRKTGEPTHDELRRITTLQQEIKMLKRDGIL